MKNKNYSLTKTKSNLSQVLEQDESLDKEDKNEVFIKPCAFYIGAHKGKGDLNSLSALNHFYATHTTRAHLVTPSISQEKLDQKWARITQELRTSSTYQINKIKINNNSIKQMVVAPEPEPAKNISCPPCIIM